MLQNLIKYKLNYKEPLVINDEIIMPGRMNILRINAGKLPSDNRINVFAHIFHTGIPGPSVLIIGGVHGNEINGIEIVRRSIEENIYAGMISGTVIVIPLLNVYGFINFTRDVADGKDVNRSFPGNLNGSLASRVARIITKRILPHTDVALDFHTGGEARYNFPQVRYLKSDMVAAKVSEAFGVRYLIEQPLIANSFRKAAYDMDVPAVVFEGGESVRLDSLSILAGIQSIKNVLSSLSMTKDYYPVLSESQWIIKKNNWIRATAPGLFIWERKSGDIIQKGDKLGEIKDPYGTKSIDVISKYSGHIIGHNNASVVSLGDALFHIGYEFDQIR